MTTPKYHIEDIFNAEAAHPDDSHSIQARLIPPNSHVLELGCASGYMSGYLEQKKGCTVVGLDYDPLAIEIAKTRTTAAYLADLEAPQPLDVAKPHAPFDVLYAANVLEHVRSAETVLKEAHALLKSNALLVLTLPNIAHYSVRLRLLMGRFDYTDYGVMDRTHVHFYTVDTARALIEQNGYRVESLHIAGSFLQNWLNQRARKADNPLPAPMLPNLLGYEITFVAHLSH
jgi:2-polyprenyl-3-methyl-5-hydroxy-6-metoxy-1,4-benzoquinol methylase